MANDSVTTARRVIHNSLSNMTALVANVLIGFFLVKFLLGRLGEARYGIWVLVGSVFRYRNILSLGLNSAVNRYVPILHSRNDGFGIRQVCSTAFCFYVVVGIVLLAGTVLVGVKFPSWFAVDSTSSDAVSALVMIVGVSFAIGMPLQLYSGVLSGLQRYDLMNVILVIILVARTVLVVTLLSYGYGLIALGMTFGVSEILSGVLQFTCVRQLLPRLSLSPRCVNLRLFGEMIHYGTNTFLYSIGGILAYKTSGLVVGVFLGAAEVSHFDVPVTVVLLLTQLVQTFTGVIKPSVSDLDARNESDRLRELALLAQKYSLLIMTPGMIFLLLMGAEFLTIWVGSEFRDPSVIARMNTVLAILTIGECLRLAQHSNFLVLVGMGHHGMFGLFTAIGVLVGVSGAIIVTKLLGLGLIAVALANAVPTTALSVIVLPWLFRRRMGIPFLETASRVLWPAILGSFPAVVLLVACKVFYPLRNWLDLLLVISATVAVSLTSIWSLGLSNGERARFLRILVPRFLAAG